MRHDTKKSIPNGTRKKRILLVSNSTWNIYNFRINLVKHFVRQGIEVFVAAPIDRYVHYLNELPGVTHIHLKHLKRDSKGIISNIRSLIELKNTYLDVSPDLILQFTIKPNILGSIAASAAKIPCISVVTGLGYTFLDSTWLKMLTKWMYHFSFRHCQKVVFENPDDQQLFLDLNLVQPAQATVVNGCGVDVNFFRPLNKEKKDGHFVFTFIGRLLYDKGIREFVEAAKKLSGNNHKLTFWVVGEMDNDNPSSITQKDINKWLKDKTVIYHGATDDVREIISKSDCVVLPSYREGLPKVILEGMAMGKPIITTNTPGCREAVVHNLNGYLVSPKSISELVAAMECISSSSAHEIEQLGRESRKVVINKFEDKIIVRQFSEIINRLPVNIQLVDYLHGKIASYTKEKTTIS